MLAYLALAAGSGSVFAQQRDIVVLGDSLSAVYGLSSEQGWVAALEKELNAELPGWRVVNASFSGATTAAGLQRLPDLLEKHQPEWVILELGGNDGLQGKPVAYIRRNLSELIELSQGAGANVLLLGIRLPPNMGARYTGPFFDMYADLSQTYHLPYVPFLLEGIAGDANLMLEDGIHPNSRGQALILANVWPVLEPALKAAIATD